MFKFKKIDDYLFDILDNSEIFFSGHKLLNDPNESVLRFMQQQEINNNSFKNIQFDNPKYFTIDNEFYFCMTRDKKSIPLWSYYGDNHKGVCLEFDFSSAIIQYIDHPDWPLKIESEPYFPFINNINYMKTLDSFTLAPNGDLNLSFEETVNFGFNKLNCWEHEKEVRIKIIDNFATSNNELKNGINWKIKKEWLKGIYFGLCTNEIDKQKIISKAKSNNYSLNIYEGYNIIHDDKDFIIEYRKLL